MGEVIVFKAEKDGTHLRPPPEGSAKIVFFTGVWHEPINDRGGKKRRASGLGKASAVTRIAPAARAIELTSRNLAELLDPGELLLSNITLPWQGSLRRLTAKLPGKLGCSHHVVQILGALRYHCRPSR